MWIAALLVAAVLITWSTVVLIRANPTSRVPLMGRAENEPGSVVLLRLAGLAVGLVGGLLLAPLSQRVPFGIGVLLIMVPTLVLQVLHNRSLGASSTTS